MVSALKQMRMTRNFQEVTLQNAIVNATYAAVIESELPTQEVFAQLGMGQTAFSDYFNAYMASMAEYVAASKNIMIDGVKIPHLFPGSKFNLKPAGTPGGVGTEYEESLLRNIAAALGLSYEQFSRDYTKTNYSSARASMAETWKFMESRKKLVADRFASMVYTLWLEEEINDGNVPLPRARPGATSMTRCSVMRFATLNGSVPAVARLTRRKKPKPRSCVSRMACQRTKPKLRAWVAISVRCLSSARGKKI